MTKENVTTGKALKTAGVILSLSAVALIGGMIGCAGDHHRQYSGERSDESAESSRVRGALAADTEYKYGNVQVYTYRGVVQLTGFVNSRDQKNRAGDLARRVDGIRGVENNIVVRESTN